jgi:hypothetical protein
MPKFSEREGYVPMRSVIQTDDLDNDTRLHIWNMILRVNRAISDRHPLSARRRFIGEIWAVGLNAAIDEEPGDSAVWYTAKRVVMDDLWFKALDFVEQYISIVGREVQMDGDLRALFNTVFEHKLVGFRFIEGVLVRVDDQQNADAIQNAMSETTAVAGARTHLTNAARMLSDRSNPDYANSVKEAISAVEAVVRDVTGESTLSAGLTKLRGSQRPLHPALLAAWTKLYAWTSDASGIRHGSIEKSDVDQALAKYMLVTCSAFVSYFLQTAATR